jgi:hypothetical protein
MNAEIYKIISDELWCYNPWIQDCVSIDEYVWKNADKENNDYMLRQMNSRLSKFDVGSLILIFTLMIIIIIIVIVMSY